MASDFFVLWFLLIAKSASKFDMLLNIRYIGIDLGLFHHSIPHNIPTLDSIINLKITQNFMLESKVTLFCGNRDYATLWRYSFMIG